MSNPFVRRRPWAAALISLVFSPFAGMLYLNRGWLALGYLAAGITVAILTALFVPLGTHPSDVMSLAQWPVSLIGSVHSFVLAKKWDENALRRWYSRWYAIIAIATAPLVLVLLVRTFLYQPFNAPSVSMTPTINAGDYFFVSKFEYQFRSPERGDVIVFHAPQLDNGSYVKRIVGLPGDRIQMKNGVLYINSMEAKQRRISDFAEDCGLGTVCGVPQYAETLPGGRTELVLDRVRSGPSDNTPVFLVPAGSYFVLGDNRDNSYDSRADIGFVSRASIIGKVSRKFIANGHWIWRAVQ